MKSSPPQLKNSFRRRTGQTLRVLLVAYLATAAGCAAWQRRMIYFPTTASSANLDRLAATEGLGRWTNAAGQNIGWKRAAPRTAQGQVLITHGNGGCAVHRAAFANAIQSALPLDVFILEYPGYGDRTGSPSETALFEAAEDAFRCLPTNAPVYLFGESLGSGVAARLAGTHPSAVAGLVLSAPFNSLVDVAQYHIRILPARWILRDRFESEKHLRDYRGPVAIQVGGNDNIVPEKFGRRLFDGYAGPKRLWEIPDGDHEAIYSQGDIFWREVMGFWRTNAIRSMP